MDVNGGTNDFNTTSKSIPAGTTYTITGSVPSCSSGAKYAYTKTDIDINYSTANINNLSQQGSADIVGTCS
jgi:hypothetical protein